MTQVEESMAIVTKSSVRVPSSAPEGGPGVPPIEVRIEETPDEVIVRIAGQAGVQQVGHLSAALLGLSCRRPSLVTLDLSGLSFVSSLAMGALVVFCRGFVRAGSRVRLLPALQEPVREALARAELLSLFSLPEETEVRVSDALPSIST
jgi:anti-anti-sigma factor